MNPNDRQKFAAIVTGFAELRGKALSHAALDLYWHAMQDWNISDFEAAAGHLLRSCQFMPTPKEFNDLRRAANPTAGEAWAAVLQHLRGAYRTAGLSPEIDRAVAAVGGYRTLAMMPTDQLPWQAKRFAEAFAELQGTTEARTALPAITAGPVAALAHAAAATRSPAGYPNAPALHCAAPAPSPCDRRNDKSSRVNHDA